MALVLRPTGTTPIHNCLLLLRDTKQDINFSKAIGLIGPEKGNVTTDCCFKIGSITKLFTATLILQMVEEGLLKLEDYYFDLIDAASKELLSGLHVWDGKDQSSKIKIHHLLSHSTGLKDYFSDDERFLNHVMEHPSQSWNWQSVMKKYFEFELHKNPAFLPSAGFHYADTNYLLLSVLIEQLTGKQLHEVYRARIIKPLGLWNTYLEYFEFPENNTNAVFPYFGTHSLESINTSFDWGGGGLISNLKDLDIFIRGLLNNVLFEKKETLELMLRLQNNYSLTDDSAAPYPYGLGIQKKNSAGFSFFGHNSTYGAMLYYDPEKEISLILSIGQFAAMHKAEWMFNKIITTVLK